ncbi:MAG: response regulator [Acidobacteriota bacterium]
MSVLSVLDKRTINLLVVDDEESICCLLHEVLSEGGYHTEIAMSGEDALQKARQIPFDVVVSDVCLPGISGMELMRQLRREGLATEIILISAFVTTDLALEALRERVADFIPKPIVSLDGVLHSVERALERRHVQQQAAATGSPTEAQQTAELLDACMGMALRLHASPPAFFLSECAEKLGRVFGARWVDFDLGLPGEELPDRIVWPAEVDRRRLRLERRDTLAQPITIGERTLGILRVGCSALPPSPVHLDFLKTVAQMAALALERAELREEREVSFVRFLEYLVQMRERLAGFEDGHSGRVADLAVRIGRFLGFTGRGLSLLRRAAAFHDLGKLGVDPELLNRPGPLTDAELEAVRRHGEIAERLLGATSCLEDVRQILQHLGQQRPAHEEGKTQAGAGIPLESRILTAAEAFVAMTSKRPHRPAMPPEHALEQMARETGTRFDADVVQVLEALLAQTNETDPGGAERAPA